MAFVTENPPASRKMSWLFSLGVVLAVAIAWVLLFKLNEAIFTSIGVSKYISWVFLPAAIRMASVMVFEWVGVGGLFLGALFTSDLIQSNDFSEAIILSGMSAFGPMLALLICTHFFNLPSSLSGLNLKQLTIFGLIGAVCNVVPHNLYFYFSDRMETPFAGVTPMFIGDVSGTLIILYLIALILRVALPKR